MLSGTELYLALSNNFCMLPIPWEARGGAVG